MEHTKISEHFDILTWIPIVHTVGRVVCTYVIGFYEIVLCEM